NVSRSTQVVIESAKYARSATPPGLVSISTWGWIRASGEPVVQAQSEIAMSVFEMIVMVVIDCADAPRVARPQPKPSGTGSLQLGPRAESPAVGGHLRGVRRPSRTRAGPPNGSRSLRCVDVDPLGAERRPRTSRPRDRAPSQAAARRWDEPASSG